VGVVMLGFFVSLRAILRLIRSWLPRHWVPTWRATPVAAFLCLPPILLYCYLVGWKVSTIRAALMVGCSVLALAVSRSRDLRYALSLAAGLILLCDPYALFSLGFQLSFTAVAAVIVVGQYVAARHTEPTTRWRFWRLELWFIWIRRVWIGALVSSAAFVSTAPLLADAFHIVPSYSILTNLVLVPVAGIIVPVGVLGLALAVISPGLASIVFALLARLLAWSLALVQYAAAQPGAQLYVAAPSAYVMLTYYGLLVSLLLNPRRRWRRAAAGVCALLLVGSIAWQYLESRTPQLRVTFIDVGTGDAILIETPDQHRILIDGGGSYNGRFDTGAKVVAPVLWQRFIRRLDLMAMTHTHADHARGLISLLRLFPSPHVLTNGSPFNTDYLQEFHTLGTSRGTKLHTAQTGPRHWQWGDLQLTVLAPPSATHPHQATWQPPTENDRSLVIRLQYGAVRFLLTSDIEHATERWLMMHVDDLRADILQIAHHGSRTSTLPAFVARVQPQVGMVSVGAGNPYGHPHPQVLATLKQHNVRLFRTDRHGAITITTDGTTYDIAPFRPYQSPLPVRIPSSS
ncbi:MAG: DNA internalization-related competence protein ComEC/Rec2, partial [Candidatus Tectomicrobia bacterium]|nr:DNA internalization-related competence protein ComEC/Rec2 [Candidatus Tectomicrobia bacterium]